jgi:hypothetical protein
MVAELLVSFPREAGWKLLEKMDAANLNISVAYWRFIEEDEAWRLILATPLVGTKGPLFIGREIQMLLSEMPEQERDGLSLRDIAIVNPHLLEIDNLRSRYGRIEGDRSIQVRRTSIDHTEPFIYRLI